MAAKVYWKKLNVLSLWEFNLCKSENVVINIEKSTKL